MRRILQTNPTMKVPIKATRRQEAKGKEVGGKGVRREVVDCPLGNETTTMLDECLHPILSPKSLFGSPCSQCLFLSGEQTPGM